MVRVATERHRASDWSSRARACKARAPPKISPQPSRASMPSATWTSSSSGAVAEASRTSGLQRGDRGPRRRRLADPHRERRGPRDELHALRLRRRPARSDAIERLRDRCPRRGRAAPQARRGRRADGGRAGALRPRHAPEGGRARRARAGRHPPRGAAPARPCPRARSSPRRALAARRARSRLRCRARREDAPQRRRGSIGDDITIIARDGEVDARITEKRKRP